MANEPGVRGRNDRQRGRTGFAPRVRRRQGAHQRYLSPPCHTLEFSLARGKSRPLPKAAYTGPSQLSAHVGDALLGIRIGRCRRLSRQLQHGCRLILAQDRQQRGPPIRKFERVMMCGRSVLVDLSKDCRPVIDCLRFPAEETSWQASNFPGEGQFRSRHHTHTLPVRDHPRRRSRACRCRNRALRVYLRPSRAANAHFGGLKSHISRTPMLEAP